MSVVREVLTESRIVQSSLALADEVQKVFENRL